RANGLQSQAIMCGNGSAGEVRCKNSTRKHVGGHASGALASQRIKHRSDRQRRSPTARLSNIRFLDSRYAAACPSLDFWASARDRGKRKPVDMIQTKPKKRATGSRKGAGVTTKLRLDSRAIAARPRPSHTSQRGSILVNQAITDTPASSKPNGTTYPTPPVAKASRWRTLTGPVC